CDNSLHCTGADAGLTVGGGNGASSAQVGQSRHPPTGQFWSPNSCLPHFVPVSEPATSGEGDPRQASYEPPVTLPASVRGRHTGLGLFYPALAALGLLEAARECFSLKAAERFGVRAVTLSLFFLYALGGSTIEAAKHLTRPQLGALIGAGRAPCVKTLRRKLAELVPQEMAGRFLERLSRAFVASGMLDTAYLYVDGHLQVYTGKAKLAHQWSTR